MTKYSKALVALGAVIAAVAAALADGAVSTQEWGQIAVAVAAAVGVFFVPNKLDSPTYQSSKTK